MAFAHSGQINFWGISIFFYTKEKIKRPSIFDHFFANLSNLCLRPTSGRHLSQIGVREPTSVGPVWPRVVGGFMSAEVGALVTAYKTYWDKGHSDSSIALQRFDEEKFDNKRQVETDFWIIFWSSNHFLFRKLKIGVYTDDGVFDAHPGCVRAVRETAELLKKDGHDVVEVRIMFVLRR